MGSGPELEALGKLVKKADFLGSPQICAIGEALGAGPRNPHFDKLFERAWEPLVCCCPATTFPLSFFPLPTCSPDPFSSLYLKGS